MGEPPTLAEKIVKKRGIPRKNNVDGQKTWQKTWCRFEYVFTRGFFYVDENVEENVVGLNALKNFQ